MDREKLILLKGTASDAAKCEAGSFKQTDVGVQPISNEMTSGNPVKKTS